MVPTGTIQARARGVEAGRYELCWMWKKPPVAIILPVATCRRIGE
jgi:hypothetical protein